MEKFFGQIRNAIPKEMQGIPTFAPIPQPPIEGVKITDGKKNVFSDKDGNYEITTESQTITFSKENYVSQTINLYPTNTGVRSNKRDVFLQKSDATTTETKNVSNEKMFFGFKQKFVINVAIGLAVIGIGWYFYKSKKK